VKRFVASLGSIVFFLAAPVVVAGVIPWWLTDWEPGRVVAPIVIVGVILIATGISALVYSFVRFVVEGLGTPAPVAPTEHLVVGGLYRHVRNPMYVAVLAIILGQALYFGRLVLVSYALVAGTAMASFARWYEEPALARRFGESYVTYRRNVPGWVPRIRPWEESPREDQRAHPVD
jgi:protein-S-isoprenylcysteine O-methyltransferase Ste14